jgi:hypothetical protein
MWTFFQWERILHDQRWKIMVQNIEMAPELFVDVTLDWSLKFLSETIKRRSLIWLAFSEGSQLHESNSIPLQNLARQSPWYRGKTSRNCPEATYGVSKRFRVSVINKTWRTRVGDALKKFPNQPTPKNKITRQSSPVRSSNTPILNNHSGKTASPHGGDWISS